MPCLVHATDLCICHDDVSPGYLGRPFFSGVILVNQAMTGTFANDFLTVKMHLSVPNP